MSTISNAQAFCGLTAIATPSKTGVTGSLTIAGGTSRVSLPEVTESYAFKAYLAASSTAVIDTLEPDTTGSTAWASGAAQVETATAVGTITLAGNASVVVTATGMTGTPKTIAVQVALNDTAAQWADKVRIALAADADVSALFTVDGTTTAIRLTRKPTHTIDTIPFYAATIADLNIALDNGTCTGITTAATSANTVGGTVTSGVLFVDADGDNFEGSAIDMSGMKSICMENYAGEILVIDLDATYRLLNGQKTLHMVTNETLVQFNSLTFQPSVSTTPSAIIVTIQGVKSV